MKKRNTPWLKGVGVGIVLVLLSFHFAEGLLFLQDQTDISEAYTSEQTTVITLLNDQPRSQNIIIQIAPQSIYLIKYLDIEDTTITLIPGEKKNVLLNTELPREGLSPETHTIDLIARSDDDKSIAKTKVIFTVEGIAKPSLKINSEKFNLDKEEKSISVELENDGNVIMRPQPTIHISRSKEIIKTIEYKTPLQIQPEETYPLSMRVDTSSLEAGDYELLVTFSDRDGIELKTQTKIFEIKTEYETKNRKRNNLIPILVGGIFAILGAALFLVNRKLATNKDSLTQKIKTLEKKEKKMEKELQKLINETHQSVNKANKWIRKNLGEKHELR